MGRGGKTTKSQTPNTKLQTNLKLQYSMTKTGLVRRRRIGHCVLFVIWNFWSLYYSTTSKSPLAKSLDIFCLFVVPIKTD